MPDVQTEDKSGQIPPHWKKKLAPKYVEPYYILPAFDHPPPVYAGQVPPELRRE